MYEFKRLLPIFAGAALAFAAEAKVELAPVFTDSAAWRFRYGGKPLPARRSRSVLPGRA